MNGERLGRLLRIEFGDARLDVIKEKLFIWKWHIQILISLLVSSMARQRFKESLTDREKLL